jgi:hypothetical protein
LVPRTASADTLGLGTAATLDLFNATAAEAALAEAQSGGTGPDPRRVIPALLHAPPLLRAFGTAL